MSAVQPLITEIRKIEPKYSGARDLKNSVVGGVVLVALRLKVLQFFEKCRLVKLAALSLFLLQRRAAVVLHTRLHYSRRQNL